MTAIAKRYIPTFPARFSGAPPLLWVLAAQSLIVALSMWPHDGSLPSAGDGGTYMRWYYQLLGTHEEMLFTGPRTLLGPGLLLMPFVEPLGIADGLRLYAMVCALAFSAASYYLARCIMGAWGAAFAAALVALNPATMLLMHAGPNSLLGMALCLVALRTILQYAEGKTLGKWEDLAALGAICVLPHVHTGSSGVFILLIAIALPIAIAMRYHAGGKIVDKSLFGTLFAGGLFATGTAFPFYLQAVGSDEMRFYHNGAVPFWSVSYWAYPYQYASTIPALTVALIIAIGVIPVPRALWLLGIVAIIFSLLSLTHIDHYALANIILRIHCALIPLFALIAAWLICRMRRGQWLAIIMVSVGMLLVLSTSRPSPPYHDVGTLPPITMTADAQRALDYIEAMEPDATVLVESFHLYEWVEAVTSLSALKFTSPFDGYGGLRKGLNIQRDTACILGEREPRRAYTCDPIAARDRWNAEYLLILESEWAWRNYADKMHAFYDRVTDRPYMRLAYRSGEAFVYEIDGEAHRSYWDAQDRTQPPFVSAEADESDLRFERPPGPDWLLTKAAALMLIAAALMQLYRLSLATSVMAGIALLLLAFTLMGWFLFAAAMGVVAVSYIFDTVKKPCPDFSNEKSSRIMEDIEGVIGRTGLPIAVLGIIAALPLGFAFIA